MSKGSHKLGRRQDPGTFTESAVVGAPRLPCEVASKSSLALGSRRSEVST